LFHAAGDTLVFADEWYKFRRPGPVPGLGAGHRESKLIAEAEGGNKTARFILNTLRRIIVHQFHNTSPTAKMRNKWAADDGRWLKEDAANLAPFLYRLQDSEPKHYKLIVETLRLILPFFAPWKRILQLLPDYRKPVAVPLITQQIGLPTLRRECAHFSQWIGKIEKAVSE
jgi:hypothetical protein